MIHNKKGMSAIVTTLIIILLSIVALGVIWTVVKNLTDSAQQQVELGEKCRAVEIQTVAITEVSAGTGATYSLTLKRTGTGEEAIGGVKVVFLNSSQDSSGILEFGTALTPLQTATNSSMNVNVVDVDTVETTVYFVSDLGEQELCPNTVTKEF